MKHFRSNVSLVGNLCVVLACWVGLPGSHAATNVTIYDTFGPDPYTPDVNSHSIFWYYGAGIGTGAARSVATPFSFTGSAYELDSITLDVRLNGLETAPNLQIGIYYDDGGHPSLTPVASLEPNPTFATMERQAITYSFSGGTILTPNAAYWLVLQPRTFGVASEAYNVEYYVSASTYRPTGGFSVREVGYPAGGSDWTYYAGASPVFRLNGIVAVPEPSTWALFGLGGALFWCLARRRRK